MRDRTRRLILIGLDLFLGVTAVFGGVAVVPTLPLAWLAGSPFPDYTLPALALAAVGVAALAAAALLVLRREVGAPVSLVVGLAIATFEVVETATIGLDIWLHALGLRPALDPVSAALPRAGGIPMPLGISLPPWLQPFYLALGGAIVALARRPRPRRAPRGRATHPAAR